MIRFRTFLPNTAYKPGLVVNMYSACAERARAMSAWLAKFDWAPNAFDVERSAVGWLFKGLASRSLRSTE